MVHNTTERSASLHYSEEYRLLIISNYHLQLLPSLLISGTWEMYCKTTPFSKSREEITGRDITLAAANKEM